MELGDVVIVVGGDPLACGSGTYTHAIVGMANPLVLVSENGDMVWTRTHHSREFKVVGTAKPTTMLMVLGRMLSDTRLKQLGQPIGDGVDECDCELRNRAWNPLTAKCETCLLSIPAQCIPISQEELEEVLKKQDPEDFKVRYQGIPAPEPPLEFGGQKGRA